jgi:antitoxin (DNA-binding transcriptional repressor) of toxin-antitoxin stability system
MDFSTLDLDTSWNMSQKCLPMKTATIRDLRNAFPRVARWIEDGECVEITRSGKPFARLAPAPTPAPESGQMPDFLARLRENFPAETPGIGPVTVVDYDRGNR